MSDDWKVGDLALCVDASPCRCGTCSRLPMLLAEGKSYTVIEVGVPEWLLFAEQVGPSECRFCDEFAADPDRFRKIRPDEHEKCEDEFVTLLETFKRKVEVSGNNHVGGGR
jgi:hypothetical protein